MPPWSISRLLFVSLCLVTALGSVTSATAGDSLICVTIFDVVFSLVVFKVNCEDDNGFDGFPIILFDDNEDDDGVGGDAEDVSVIFVCFLLGFSMIKTICNQFVNERDYLSTNRFPRIT